MQAVKLARLKGVGIGPRTQTCVDWDGPIAMLSCLHQGQIYLKRMIRVWRDHKCMRLVGAGIPVTCAGRKLSRLKRGGIWSRSEILRKLGWTYRHGAVFAPRQYLYQKECTGMERPEMYLPSWCKNPSYLCGSSLPRLKGVSIGSRTKTHVNWGAPITMVPCLHQGNIYIERKLRA